MSPPNVITFFSNAVPPHHKLSNLYKSQDRNITVTWPVDLECVPEFLRGGTFQYPTREHAYQSLRSGDMATAEAFMVGGYFAGWESLQKWPVGKQGKTKDIMFKSKLKWGKKHMEGFVPKTAVGVNPKFWKQLCGFDIRPHQDIPEEHLRKVWWVIHAAFFIPGAGETEVLKSTAGKKLCEFHYRSKANSYYSCRFLADGTTVGQNAMGRFLQDFRDRMI